ncbi:MAG: hypothetical protein RMI94_02045 [Bryobacterales bacterium]|nr:hypothetical protein [Bryobacteraceae bacterium]MDW8129299.1 hypothetical protein [Bryobacterales bacterium]
MHTKRMILVKKPGGNDYCDSGLQSEPGKEWIPAIRLGPKRSTFDSSLEDGSRFPVGTCLKSLLKHGVERNGVSSPAMRQSSRPGH